MRKVFSWAFAHSPFPISQADGSSSLWIASITPHWHRHLPLSNTPHEHRLPRILPPRPPQLYSVCTSWDYYNEDWVQLCTRRGRAASAVKDSLHADAISNKSVRHGAYNFLSSYINHKVSRHTVPMCRHAIKPCIASFHLGQVWLDFVLPSCARD